jgi:flagellar motility protein MotE (MotC chaperone)
MKYLLIILMTFSSLANGKDDKNSQEEFDKKVKAEVERQVNLIKKKSLSQLTNELLDKDRTLMKRDETLDKREEQIKISEMSLLKKIEELETTKTKIIGCLDDHKKGELMRVKQLVEVISNMKPQKAADLLSVQESKISIKIIEKIKPEKASKIFNLMDKEVSARLQKQYLNMQQ